LYIVYAIGILPIVLYLVHQVYILFLSTFHSTNYTLSMELTYLLKYYMVLYADLSYICCIIDIDFIILNTLPDVVDTILMVNIMNKIHLLLFALVLLLILVYIIY
jgi:hypothetical protein